MKLVGRMPNIPVEPLDDERMTNIERRIVAGAAEAAARSRGTKSFRGFAVGVAAAVAVVIAGIIGWNVRGVPSPAVHTEVATTIRTDHERSTIDIGDARIASSPGTEFVVTRPDDGVLVAMTRGRVELEVGHRGDRAPLIVRAGDTDVIVVGTRFSVDFGDGTGEVDVVVTEGVVKVVRHRQEVRVAAGQAWKRDEGLVSLPANGAATARVAIVDRAAGSRAAPIAIAPEVAPHDSNAKSRHDPIAKPKVITVAKPRPLDNPSDPEFELKTLIRRQPVLPAQDIGVADATRAIASYRDVVTDRTKMGAEASLALYSVAVVQHLKLARHDDALATLDAYLRRFKGGKEYRAALWLRVRITCLRAVDSPCRQAAYTYAQEAGDTPSGRVAERITMSR